MKNKNLFWHGFRASVKKAIGEFIVLVGVMIMFGGLFFESYLIILGLGSIVFGIVLLAKGHSQRFDYKRQSGYIVHGGDA